MCAFVRKVILSANKAKRVQYGDDHILDPLLGFFDHIVYTDEAHVDPTSQARHRILREAGKRDEPEDIVERPPLKGVRFILPVGSLGTAKHADWSSIMMNKMK